MRSFILFNFNTYMIMKRIDGGMIIIFTVLVVNIILLVLDFIYG